MRSGTTRARCRNIGVVAAVVGVGVRGLVQCVAFLFAGTITTVATYAHRYDYIILIQHNFTDVKIFFSSTCQ